MFIKPVTLIVSQLSLLVFAAGTNVFEPFAPYEDADFDDDRHIKDPDDKDATNSPSLEGFTRMPSILPSAAPSYFPSKTPTYFPSTLPSHKPSVHPSEDPSQNPSHLPTVLPSKTPSKVPSGSPTTSPSFYPSKTPTWLPTRLPSSKPSVTDPCSQIRANGGTFGDINSENLLIVHYKYEVETDPVITGNMLASLGDILYAIEMDISEELVKTYFPQCGGVANPDIDIVGISARPSDLANGDSCFLTDQKINRKCDFIEGRVSFFLAEMELLSTLQVRFKNAIKSMMDAGKLNDSFPSIDKVIYVDNTIILIDNDDLEAANDDDTGTIEIFGLGSLSWGFIGLGIVLFSISFVFGRYRYFSSSHKDTNRTSWGDTRIIDDDSDEDYIYDVDSTLSDN